MSIEITNIEIELTNYNHTSEKKDETKLSFFWHLASCIVFCALNRRTIKKCAYLILWSTHIFKQATLTSDKAKYFYTWYFLNILKIFKRYIIGRMTLTNTLTTLSWQTMLHSIQYFAIFTTNFENLSSNSARVNVHYF